MRKLMAHQKLALEYGLETQHPAWLLAMRLGKTLTAIRWALELDLKTKIVIAPLTVLSSWEKELRLEGESFVRWSDYKTSEKMGAISYAFKQKRWLLINYEGVRSNGPIISNERDNTRGIPLIAQLPWDVVILDESPKIKNPQANITKICCGGFRMARHRAILTGLIAPESLMDAFTQFQFLDGSFMGFSSFWEWKFKYFQKIGYDWFPKSTMARKIKEEIHQRGFVMSAKDAGMSLKKVYEERVVSGYHDSNDPVLKMHRQVEREFAIKLSEDVSWETNYATERLIWMRKLAGGFTPDNRLISKEKLNEIIRLLKGELRRESVVVWFAFRHEISFCAKELAKKLGCSVGIITGDTPASERARIIELFARGEYRILCAMEECAKYGIDCSKAGAAFYYSNSFSGNSRIQSEDRVVHPSKCEPSLIIDLIYKGTIDEDIVQVMKDKSFEGRLIMRKLKRAFTERIAKEWLVRRK